MHWIDYIIVLLSILAAIGTGVWFAHKQKDTSQYFAGGGKIPAWAVGISIFATLISSVTFLAYPGAAIYVAEGGQLTLSSYDDCYIYRDMRAFITNKDLVIKELLGE